MKLFNNLFDNIIAIVIKEENLMGVLPPIGAGMLGRFTIEARLKIVGLKPGEKGETLASVAGLSSIPGGSKVPINHQITVPEGLNFVKGQDVVVKVDLTAISNGQFLGSRTSVNSMELLAPTVCKFKPQVIGDKSVIASHINGTLEQNAGIVLSELNLDQLIPILVNTPTEEVISKAAELTIINTPYNKQAEKDWIDKLGKDQTYSFSTAIANQICSCFHRAIYFNILMNMLSIPSTTVEGDVIVSPDLVNTERFPASRSISEWGFSKIDSFEGHAWNLVYHRGQHILVDTALRINEKPVIRSITSTERITSKYVRFIFVEPLPDGKYRYYRALETLEIM